MKKQTVKEIMEDALNRIIREHGVAVTTLGVEYINTLSAGGPALIADQINVSAILTEVVKQ